MFNKSAITNTFTAVALAVTLAACGGGGGGSAGVASGAAAVGTTPIAQAAIAGALTGATTVGATASITGKLTITGGSTTVFERPLSLSGTYGTWTMNVTTGDWTYTLDSIKASAIAPDITATDAMLVKSSDGAVSATVTVSIKGLTASDSTIVTSVAAPTYPVGSEELAAFNLLNAERGRCGFGQLAQNKLLDLTSKAHAEYQLLNNIISHYEDKTAYPLGFTGVGPDDRAAFQGYAVGLGYGGVIGITDEMNRLLYSSNKAGRGSVSIRDLLNAPYHLKGLMRGYKEIGISILSANDVITNNIGIASQFNPAIAKGVSAQMLGSSDVKTYPCQGTTGTDYKLSNEIPNPVAGRDLAAKPLGSSVFVSVRQGQVLVINSATMQAMVNGVPSGSPEVVRPAVTGSNDPLLGYYQQHEGYIVADAPMLPNTSYSVTISGTNNGAGFTTSFTFTTGTGG